MARTVVSVLRGGTSNEYDLSLETGGTFLQSLPEDVYATQDVFIDKSGAWHVRGVPTEPARALRQSDAVINALHGGIGEDGTVARILERLSIPFTGSRAHAAAHSLHKVRAQDTLRAAGVRVPHSATFLADPELDAMAYARAVFEQFGPPYIVKPVSSGASEGISIARTVIELAQVIHDMLALYEAVLVEEFIRGKEISVGVVEDFRDEPLYAFPAAEIVPPQGEKYLTQQAYADMSFGVLAPAPSIPTERKRDIESIAKKAHRALGLPHYSRADFIVTPKQVYLLEVNSLPALYPGTPLYESMSAVGVETPYFSKHLLGLAERA